MPSPRSEAVSTAVGAQWCADPAGHDQEWSVGFAPATPASWSPTGLGALIGLACAANVLPLRYTSCLRVSSTRRVPLRYVFRIPLSPWGAALRFGRPAPGWDQGEYQGQQGGNDERLRSHGAQGVGDESRAGASSGDTVDKADGGAQRDGPWQAIVETVPDTWRPGRAACRWGRSRRDTLACTGDAHRSFTARRSRQSVHVADPI